MRKAKRHSRITLTESIGVGGYPALEFTALVYKFDNKKRLLIE